MNELQVTVQQKPGEVKWNFQELKEALGKELQTYENTVYDDDSIKDAKKDAAYLRKLKDSVESKRKEIKNMCLEPYAVIEKQAKELAELIDKPIAAITKRVDEYEIERKAKCKKEIHLYMAGVFDKVPEDIRQKAIDKCYDSKWENVSTTKKTWQTAIDSFAKQILDDVNVIKGVEEEFREDAIQMYKTRLTLSDAMNKVQELRAQKEKILKAERERKEAEERARKEAEEKVAAEVAHDEAVAIEDCHNAGKPVTPGNATGTPRAGHIPR